MGSSGAKSGELSGAALASSAADVFGRIKTKLDKAFECYSDIAELSPSLSQIVDDSLKLDRAELIDNYGEHG